MNDFWKDKNVFLTGAGGFIGSCVARRLCDSGANVTCLIRNTSSVPVNDDLLRRCNVFVGSVTDGDLMREILSATECEHIFHFAAFPIVRVCAHDPKSTYEINVMGTVNVLEAARQVGRCKSIVVASSDKAYGDHEKLPYREDYPLMPSNTYDTSKACMDMISRAYAVNYDLPVTVGRSSNVYGPRDMNWSRVVPGNILRVHRGASPILHEGSADMEREFIYIDDVVDAYEAAALNIRHFAGLPFNVGGARPKKIGDVVGMICKEMGRPDLSPVVEEREDSFREIHKQCIVEAELLREVGWEPTVDFDTGLRNTVKWYREFLDGSMT